MPKSYIYIYIYIYILWETCEEFCRCATESALAPVRSHMIMRHDNLLVAIWNVHMHACLENFVATLTKFPCIATI